MTWAFLLGTAKLLLDPRTWLIALLAALIGFINGCVDEKTRGAARDAVRDKIDAVTAEHRKGVIARQLEVKDEIESLSDLSMASLHDQLDDAQLRLRERANSLRAGVQGGAGAAKPVPPSDAERAEREFLAGVYTSAILCYPAGALVEGVRGHLARALERSRGHALAALDAMDDATWWGEWGNKIGACTP